MSIVKMCFYCSNPFTTKNNEHVFPDALGGHKVMMDCVCAECNQEFSKCEGELISKSFISFIRAAESPTDLPQKKQYFMKEVRTHRMDDDLNVALEVQVGNGLREKLVAQIILKDKMHIRYEFQDDFNKLMSSISTWKKDNRNLTLKSNNKILSYEVSRDNTNQTVKTTSISVVKAGYIGLEISKDGDKINDSLSPRIYNDAKDRLKIRARNEQEAIELIRHLLWWNENTAPVVEKVVEHISEISVQHNHDGVKMNRALVKIAINALVHYYPDSKNEREKLLVPISFARYGQGHVPFHVIHKKSELESKPKTHNLFFYNNADVTFIRISLYNGAFIIVFHFPKINTIESNGPGRLLIDHQLFKNSFQK